MSIYNNPPPTFIQYDDGVKSLIIRFCQLSDIDMLLEAIDESIVELRQFLPWAHSPQTKEKQAERMHKIISEIGQGGDLYYHFFDGKDHAFLGCVGLHHSTSNNKAFELGYWCRSSRTGEGWTTLVAQCMVVLGLKHLHAERIQCCYNEANMASQRIANKVGFNQEARLKNYETQPNETQKKAGSLIKPYMIMSSIFPEDRTQLSWYSQIANHLTIHTS